MKVPNTTAILHPARFPEETQEEYRLRRSIANKTSKNYLKGSYIYQHSFGVKGKPFRKPDATKD